MIDDSRKRQLMMNIFYEANGSPESILDLNLDDNPFVQMLDTFPVVLGLIRRLCDELGLQSSHDFEGSFTSELLIEKHSILIAIVNDILSLIDATASAAKDDTKRLIGNLQVIFKTFNGCQLHASRSRPRKSRESRRPSLYHYKLEPIGSLDKLVRNTIKISI